MCDDASRYAMYSKKYVAQVMHDILKYIPCGGCYILSRDSGKSTLVRQGLLHLHKIIGAMLGLALHFRNEDLSTRLWLVVMRAVDSVLTR